MAHQHTDDSLERRKKFYEAEVALLDFIELFADTLSDPVAHLADKVYCYCNVKGSKTVFRSFYTEGEEAYDLQDALDASTYAKLEDTALAQLELMRRFYSYWTELIPSELFLDYEPVSGALHAMRTDNDFCSEYDARIRFKAWLEEHGGKGKPIGPRYSGLEEKLMWTLFKKGEEKVKNPTAGAVVIDMKALQASREKLKKLETPSANYAPSMVFGYSGEVSGFLAIKDAFDERYPNDDSPDYLYYEDVEELRDDYKLFRKGYNYSCYEYIAIYEDVDCWHVLSLGMSNLDSEVDTWNTYYNAEYTMRIRKYEDKKLDEAESANAINLVAALADEACNEKRMLEDYSYISLGHRKGMDYKRESDKVAFIIVPDTRVSSVEGPFGTVNMRQAVPITREEYRALKAKQIDVRTIYEKIGTDLVDYDRPSVI